MGVLLFDDSGSNKIEWTTLTATLADVTDGAWTMCVVYKMDTTAAFCGFSYMLNGAGAGTAQAGATYSPSSNKYLMDFGSARASPTNVNTTNVYMAVFSKGAGTVIPRVSWKIGAAGAWTHDAFDNSQADMSDSTMLRIGAWQNSDYMSGHIGVVGWWEGAMSDGQKETLDDNWRTSDLWNASFGTPKFLAELNVAGASVVDLAGNASSISVVGTSLDAGQTLDSWNFDGTGTTAASAAWVTTL